MSIHSGVGASLQVVVEVLGQVHGPVLLVLALAQAVLLAVVDEHVRFLPEPPHRGEELDALYHGTASSSSLWIVRYGVWTFSTQKIGEFSMNCSGLSHGGAPMRLCVFSYWNARDMPVPQRMPP